MKYSTQVLSKTVYQRRATSGHSDYYFARLKAAINSKSQIIIFVQKRIGSVDIDDFSGGGITLGKTGERQKVAIIGNSNHNLKTKQRKSLRDDAADILAHELVGHAIPNIIGSDIGNAVKNSNKVRLENDGAKKLRAKEPTHKEEGVSK